MDKTQFVALPGSGYLFFKSSHPDNTSPKAKAKHEVSIWQGHLTLPGDKRVQLRATHSTRKGMYTIAMHEFNTWNKIGETEIPELGGMDYSDSKIKVENRTYDIRMIRTDQGYFLVRLPQVLQAKRAAKYMR